MNRIRANGLDFAYVEEGDGPLVILLHGFPDTAHSWNRQIPALAAAGIPEDPATGSSHCTLAPYWAARLAKNQLTAKQLSPRGGDLLCELRGDRVVIAGHVVEYLRGEIETEGPAI